MKNRIGALGLVMGGLAVTVGIGLGTGTDKGSSTQAYWVYCVEAQTLGRALPEVCVPDPL